MALDWTEDHEKVYQGGSDLVDLVEIIVKMIKKDEEFDLMKLINEGYDLKNLVDHARTYPKDQIEEYALNCLSAAGHEGTWRFKKPVKSIT